jgi:hypothetical protein
MSEHTDFVYRAKLAEQAERYDEMVEMMKAVASNAKQELDVEERNLLSVGYKNVIGEWARRAPWASSLFMHAHMLTLNRTLLSAPTGSRRASWRIVSSIEQKELETHGESKKLSIIRVSSWKTLHAHTCMHILTRTTMHACRSSARRLRRSSRTSATTS